jgi:hypothetical protein
VDRTDWPSNLELQLPSISKFDAMENLAYAFDQPIESREHQDLATTAWMGGEDVSVRYWLGRLLRRNFFRESDDAVKDALQKYFIEVGCEKGAPLVSDYQAWSSVATLLQSQVEIYDGRPPTKNPRVVAAIRAFFANPELTDVELAAIAKTTEKQIARMSDVTVLRRLRKLQGA